MCPPPFSRAFPRAFPRESDHDDWDDEQHDEQNVVAEGSFSRSRCPSPESQDQEVEHDELAAMAQNISRSTHSCLRRQNQEFRHEHAAVAQNPPSQSSIHSSALTLTNPRARGRPFQHESTEDAPAGLPTPPRSMSPPKRRIASETNHSPSKKSKSSSDSTQASLNDRFSNFNLNLDPQTAPPMPQTTPLPPPLVPMETCFSDYSPMEPSFSDYSASPQPDFQSSAGWSDFLESDPSRSPSKVRLLDTSEDSNKILSSGELSFLPWAYRSPERQSTRSSERTSGSIGTRDESDAIAVLDPEDFVDPSFEDKEEVHMHWNPIKHHVPLGNSELPPLSPKMDVYLEETKDLLPPGTGYFAPDVRTFCMSEGLGISHGSDPWEKYLGFMAIESTKAACHSTASDNLDFCSTDLELESIPDFARRSESPDYAEEPSPPLSPSEHLPDHMSDIICRKPLGEGHEMWIRRQVPEPVEKYWKRTVRTRRGNGYIVSDFGDIGMQMVIQDKSWAERDREALKDAFHRGVDGKFDVEAAKRYWEFLIEHTASPTVCDDCES